MKIKIYEHKEFALNSKKIPRRNMRITRFERYRCIMKKLWCYDLLRQGQQNCEIGTKFFSVPNIFDSSSRYRYVELCSTMHWCFKIHIASSPQPTDPQCNAFHNVLALHNAMHCNASQCNALQWTCRQKHRTNSATDNEKQQFWQKLQIFCSSSSTALSTQLSIVSLITF